MTAGGTVRRKAVTVAIATSSGLYLVEQLCPAVTMLGLRRVPSRYTWWSDMALYTAARTCKSLKSFPSIPSLLLHHHQHQHHHHQPTFSVTYWPRFRSWSPSGKISGSMMGTMPCWPGEENSVRTTRDAQISSAGSNLLTDAAVTCKNIRVGHDGQSRGVGVADFKHAAPLCKGSAVLFILRATLW